MQHVGSVNSTVSALSAKKTRGKNIKSKLKKEILCKIARTSEQFYSFKKNEHLICFITSSKR